MDQMIKIAVVLLMLFTLFASCAKKSPEAEFWTWFEKNEDMLFHFERDQERTFDRLNVAMHKVHPDITFEFGPDENGKREFVISADGLKTAFPAVESLYAAAPSLPRWKFIKFRPRRSPMELQIGELRIKPEDIEVAIEADGNKAGLTVFVHGFNNAKEKHFSQAAFIMLDQAIGEYDMEAKVGFITIKTFEETSQYQRHSLAALPAIFDEFLKK
jgi:hypothetical protein